MFADRYSQHGVAFVVFVFDVKSWIKFFDPGVFELERFNFAGDDCPFHAGGSGDHVSGAWMELYEVLKVVGEAGS